MGGLRGKMDHDARDYDQNRAEFKRLRQSLKNHPGRLTRQWLWLATEQQLLDFRTLWRLSHALFYNTTDGNRAERVQAEIERRSKLYEANVKSVMPGWEGDQRRLNILMGRKERSWKRDSYG